MIDSSVSDRIRLELAGDGGRCSLTIDRVSVDDEAEYVCTATNEHGSVSTWAELLVESSYSLTRIGVFTIGPLGPYALPP